MGNASVELCRFCISTFDVVYNDLSNGVRYIGVFEFVNEIIFTLPNATMIMSSATVNLRGWRLL